MTALGRGHGTLLWVLATLLVSCIPPPQPEEKRPPPKTHDVDFARFRVQVEKTQARCLRLQGQYAAAGHLVITTAVTLHADGTPASVQTTRNDGGPLPDNDVRCIANGIRSGIRFSAPQPEGRTVSWGVIYY